MPRKSTCGVGSGVCTQGDRLQLTFQPIEAAGLARTPSRTWRKQTSIVRVVRSSSKQHRCCEHAPSHGLIVNLLRSRHQTFKFESLNMYMIRAAAATVAFAMLVNPCSAALRRPLTDAEVDKLAEQWEEASRFPSLSL